MKKLLMVLGLSTLVGVGCDSNDLGQNLPAPAAPTPTRPEPGPLTPVSGEAEAPQVRAPLPPEEPVVPVTPEPQTPAEVGIAFAEAVTEADVPGLKQLLPTKHQLGRLLDCPEQGGLWQHIVDERARFQRAARHLEGVSLTWIRMDDSGLEQRQLAPGDKFRGCTAKKRITVVDTRFVLQGERGELREELTLKAKLLRQADGTTFLIDL